MARLHSYPAIESSRGGTRTAQAPQPPITTTPVPTDRHTSRFSAFWNLIGIKTNKCPYSSTYLAKELHTVGFDPEKHHRRSLRLKCYDYSKPGFYFVTICLQGREPYLQMPEVRKIVEDMWKTLPQRFPTIELDEFVVMPNHIHFILNLHPDHKHGPTLSNIVCAYKSLTAHAALSHLRTLGDICANQFWQPGFYDHIICNETELHAIRQYIRDNPLKTDFLFQ